MRRRLRQAAFTDCCRKERQMIELVVLDIDGVVTDGTVTVDAKGTERKQVNLKDIDAVFELHRRGWKLAAMTGEDTQIVDYFEERFPWTYFYRGIKEKKDALYRLAQEAGIPKEQICYVGDGKYDVGPLAYAGLGICPADAIDRARGAADIILQNSGGKGCLWELVSILERYNDGACAQHYFFDRLMEHTDIFKKLASDQELAKVVMEVGDRIWGLFQKKGAVYLCGNGGSAADAQHIATEFISRFYKERQALNAEALSVNTSTLTAVGNDYSFERVFVRQLEAKAHPGDMVIGISTSGTSRNVWEALKYARENGILTVLMTGGAEHTELENMVDYSIQIPSFVTPRIQEAHIFIGHIIAEYVEHRMFGE